MDDSILSKENKGRGQVNLISALSRPIWLCIIPTRKHPIIARTLANHSMFRADITIKELKQLHVSTSTLHYKDSITPHHTHHRNVRPLLPPMARTLPQPTSIHLPPSPRNLPPNAPHPLRPPRAPLRPPLLPILKTPPLLRPRRLRLRLRLALVPDLLLRARVPLLRRQLPGPWT